jgi:ABC-type transport system involved in multi-copper enzyme maturation permease subunit
MHLPIAERELRVASRNPRTYRARLISSVIFGVITGWMFWISTKVSQPWTVAPQTYAFIAQMALIMCMFTANVTADALSSEKRNGTLGLLFLTDLKGIDIVFGKLAAFGLVSFYSLVGIIPILAMPVLIGGVTGETVLRTALTLLNALFLALSLGLWVSARSWEQKRAMNVAVWLVIMLLWLVPGLATAIRFRYPQWAQAAEWLFIVSPAYQQARSNPFGIGMMMDHYWLSLAVTHAIGWLALWRACSLLPRAWQDRAILPAQRGLKKFWQDLRYGSPQIRAQLRARLLAINPVHWLGSRERFAPINSWLFVFAVIVGWAVLWLWVRSKIGAGGGGPPFWALGMPAGMILYLGFRIRTCALAGEVIARDRFSGALELLLSTTITEREVVRGQWLTFARTIMGPAIASVFVSTPAFVGLLIEDQGNGRPNNSTFCWIYAALILLFVFDLIAAVWTGMWCACFARTAQSAPGQAVVRLLLLPWFAFMGIATISSLLRLGGNLEFPEVFAGWWFLCMANNLFWIFRSRAKFYDQLRKAAAEAYQPPVARTRSWRTIFQRNAPQQIGLSKAT